MGSDAVVRGIAKGTREAGKTYSFNDTHDPCRPAQFWFQEAQEGLVLFVVFYTQACRWSRCLGCNLPSLMSQQHVPFDRIMAQIDAVFAEPQVAGRLGDIRKLIVSNNGSVLDQDTFSSTALMYLLAMVNLRLPGLRVLSLETRPEYVDLEELEFLARGLAEAEQERSLEIAIGFEAFDDRLRNEVFAKGLTLPTFERLVRDMAPYGFSLKCYFMQKPVPGLADDAAVADIQAAIDYLAAMAGAHGLAINMHLNPTYVARDTRLAEAYSQGRYTPPRLSDVARAVLHGRGKPVTIFVGLSDEGLAVPGGSFRQPGDEALVAALAAFNQTQDYAALAAAFP